MATYKQIEDYVKKNNGYVVKSCWIAHAKEIYGLNPKISKRRYDVNKRVNPCPPAKQEDIKKAFEHFGML